MDTTDQNNVRIRKSDDRGYADRGWLKSYHTFSFADYHNPEFMEFRTLRVINEDIIEPGQGFGTHPHKDMEIITYVIEGALEHKDSMGNGSVIRAGNVQRMSAGSGITHSEFNHSKKEKVHLIQIWVNTNELNLEPSYEEITLDKNDPSLRLIGSQDGRSDSVTIHQDVQLYYGDLKTGELVNYTIDKGRGLWLQLIEGTIHVANADLKSGDGISIENIDAIQIKAQKPSAFLLFDLK